MAGRRHRIAALYDHPGPFVTVYVDATRTTESGAHDIELRWNDLRSGLAAHGASDTDLGAVAAELDADRGTPGRHGLVVVAAGGQALLTDVLAEPPPLGSATVSPLPQLMPYLAQRAGDVPHVVVVTDRTGADIIAPDAVHDEVTGGSPHPIHRTGRDDWSERHFQQRVENAWEANARDVAAQVSRHVDRSGAQLVVVAGDVRARAMVAADVRSIVPERVEVRVVEDGGRAPGASSEALRSAVHHEVLRTVWSRRREVLEHVRQNLGRERYAAAGVVPVVAALQMAQVDTLILSDDPSSTLRAWVGPGPTAFGLDPAEAADLGVGVVGEDRLDAALVRAAAGTGARLLVTPGAHDYVESGVAALLRFDL